MSFLNVKINLPFYIISIYDWYYGFLDYLSREPWYQIAVLSELIEKDLQILSFKLLNLGN